MEPYHRALVVGNIAGFDEEAASSGELRFIWFDECGLVVHEARVEVEDAQKLAAFQYGDFLKNPELIKWWNDPGNVKVGPYQVFEAQ
jgi:hypothetical protein